MKHDCAYCEESLKNKKAEWDKKIDGWVCVPCKEILDEERRKR